MFDESKPPQTEIQKHLWVPMREANGSLNFSSRAEYQGIAWNPNQIYDGKHLEIDVTGINNFLHDLKIDYPIEIRSYNPPREINEYPQVSSIDASGTAVMSKSASKNKRPPTHQFTFDLESEKGIVFINFKGLADHVEQKLVGGRNNPKFEEEYGKGVNRALKQGIGIKAIFESMFLRAREIDRGREFDIGEQTTLDAALGNLAIPSAILFSFLMACNSFTKMLVENNYLPERAVSAVSWTILSLPLFYSTFNAVAYYFFRNDKGISWMKNRADYLKQKLMSKDFLEAFIPCFTISYCALPFIISQFHHEPFIRGKK